MTAQSNAAVPPPAETLRPEDVVLAPDVAAELALADDATLAGSPLLAASAWLPVCGLADLRTRLSQRCDDTGQPLDAEGVADAITRLAERTHWLAALACDVDVRDPLAFGLGQAVDRMREGAIVATRDESLLAAIPQARRPEAIVAEESQRVDFLDLRSQQHRVRGEIERGLAQVMHHGQYVLGPELREMEARLAEYCGTKHAVAVASGTDSLVIALMALGIGPGDEVVTVPYTWISTAEAPLLVGAKPVFVDIEADTFNIDPALIEAAITPATKAIMPVSLYGQCADMQAINEIAARHNLPVIEDAAQSFGATHHGGRSCGLSTIGSTSFFPTKPLGGYGDGGALFTDDDALAERFRQIRVHGQKKKHEHPIVGMNGRMDTMQAAVVLAKMAIFDDECIARRTVAARYEKLFADHKLHQVRCPQIRPENESVYAQYTIQLRSEGERDLLRAGLAERGVPAVPYYIVPVPFQGAMAELGHHPGDFPVCERVASSSISLPMSPYLQSHQQTRIVEAIAEVLGQSAGRLAA